MSKTLQKNAASGAWKLPQLGKEICLFAALAVFKCSVAAQTQNSDEDLNLARALATQAEALTLSGNTQRALELVTQQLQRDPAWPKPAEALFYSELAWVHHEAAKGPDGSRLNSLLQSSNYYERVLTLYPSHTQAAENLAQVLRELGNSAAAIDRLDRNSFTNETIVEKYERLLAIGDLCGEANQAERAVGFYEEAFTLRPDDDRAPWRIVGNYIRVPESWNTRLFKDCGRFSAAGLPQVASRGYEHLISKNSAKGATSQIITDSVEAWIESESQSATLTSASLRRLPNRIVETSQAVRELKPWIENPPGPDLVYWQGSLIRRHIAVLALRSLARSQRIAGQPMRAEIICQNALAIAPAYYAYTDELRDKPIIGLDVALDLAALYQAFPSLDADGRKFQKLENGLLEEKTMAYVEKNLTAVQKFHTVLGIIYAERGRWNSGDWRAAPYHLERAVSTAQSLAQREPSEYKPLPQLTRLLADGLATNSHPDRVRARSLYLDSAQGYLDNDDLSGATTSLKIVAALSVQNTNEQRYLELNQILDTRRNVRNLQLKDYHPGTSGDKLNLDANRWVKLGNGTALDPAFLQRQRVRVLTELSTKAQTVGATTEAEELHKAAFRQLESASGATHEDLRRLVESPVNSATARTPGANLTVPRKDLRPDQQILKASDLRQIKEANLNKADSIRNAAP